jgi:hypothetical protein
LFAGLSVSRLSQSLRGAGKPRVNDSAKLECDGFHGGFEGLQVLSTER